MTDSEYTWGRPLSTYLTPREEARIRLLASRLQEQRQTTSSARDAHPDLGGDQAVSGAS